MLQGGARDAYVDNLQDRAQNWIRSSRRNIIHSETFAVVATDTRGAQGNSKRSLFPINVPIDFWRRAKLDPGGLSYTAREFTADRCSM